MAIRTDHPEPDAGLADERAVRELFEKLLEDWGRGDGGAYGSRFTEDADYVAFDGARTKGREEISSSHQQLFDKFLKGTRLTGHLLSIKFPGPDVALVHATGGTILRGKTKPSPERDSIQTLVAVKRGGGVAIRRFPQHARASHRPRRVHVPDLGGHGPPVEGLRSQGERRMNYTMRKGRGALIIGGGIAGPVAAMALRRAGIEAVVYEAYAGGADDTGTFLTFASNGLDALRAIDAHRLVLAVGFPTPRMAIQSGTGKHLGEVPNGGTLPDGTVSQTLKRADLYRALRDEAVRRGVRIEYGKRLVDAETTSDGGVVARFEDGTEAEGGLLIGADGIHSRTRCIIDPSAPPARCVPVLNIGGYARGVRVQAGPGTFRMIFGRRAFFGYAVHPSGEVWWFANPPRADEPGGEEFAATTTEQWKEMLTDLFAGDDTPAVEIIQATPGRLVGWTTHDLPSVPKWHRGSMIVIGDAAHATAPSSGQGASMAVEDAVVLARCLRDLPDTRQAFAAYERLRRGRVERIVAHGARTSNSKAAGPVGRALRDLMLPVILKRVAGGSLAWMHDHHISWDEKVAA